MDFVAAGFNYRMTDFQAALVGSQLQRLPAILDMKERLAKVYFQELNNNSLIKMPSVPDSYRHTWQTFHVLLSDDLNQSEVIDYLRTRGIGTNYGAQCIPYQTYFANKYNLDCSGKFPNALRAFKKGLALPIYEKLSEKDIKYIADTLNEITAS